MPRPPVVAISSTAEIIRGSLRVRLNTAYVRAVEQAGALPLVVPPLAQLAHVGALLDRADALLLTGGEDVDPAHYGAEPHPALGELNRERDATELALVAAAHERTLPTLAVCRGVQLLNVALGGTLIQDLPSERPSDVPHDSDGERSRRVHEVRVAAGSRLARALGATALRVNSFHHQVVDRIAPSLRATAWSSDGLIEGVETGDDAWWVLGVQWHPEEMTETPEPWDRDLFGALSARAGSR